MPLNEKSGSGENPEEKSPDPRRQFIILFLSAFFCREVSIPETFYSSSMAEDESLT